MTEPQFQPLSEGERFIAEHERRIKQKICRVIPGSEALRQAIQDGMTLVLLGTCSVCSRRTVELSRNGECSVCRKIAEDEASSTGPGKQG